MDNTSWERYRVIDWDKLAKGLGLPDEDTKLKETVKKQIINNEYLLNKIDYKTEMQKSNIAKRLMPVWKSIISCRKYQNQFNPCPILISPDNGVFPRGFGFQPNIKEVDVVFLLNNPGVAYSSEKEYYKKAFLKGYESLAMSISNFVWEINTGQLPNETRDNNYRGLNNVFSNKFFDIIDMGLTLYISQMVKCQTNKSGSWVKAISPCADHLLAELEALNPKAIISTVKRQGNTVLNSIATKQFIKWHNRTIMVGYPHGAARRAGQGVSTDDLPKKWYDWDDSIKELIHLLNKR